MCKFNLFAINNLTIIAKYLKPLHAFSHKTSLFYSFEPCLDNKFISQIGGMYTAVNSIIIV